MTIRLFSSIRRLAFCFSALVALSTAAQADGWNQSFSTSQNTSFANFTSASSWSGVVGGGMGFAPRYSGSDRLRFLAIPVVNVAYNQGFVYAGTTQGIGMTPLMGENYHVRFGLGYDGGRYTSDDSKNLNGLNKITYSILGVVSGDYTYNSITGRLKAQTALTGDYGSTINFSLGTTAPLREDMMLLGNIHTQWADSEHMHKFYGVKTNEAAASGKSYFEARQGFENFGMTFGMKYALTPEVALIPSMTTDVLVGDAARSPVSVSDFQPSGHVAATYSF